tara:strand:+ start:32 stop:805 length:774 start_codon:yes stop_codon:yes gene_type:complete
MVKFKLSEIKSFLDFKADLYENENFIENDPISIPHIFSKKEDIEISAFITATISWGQRKTILKNANQIIEMMDLSPFDFIKNHSKFDLKPLSKFVHRTFNGTDLIFFIVSLKNIYMNHGGLENLFKPNSINQNMGEVINQMKKTFFSISHKNRTRKHISDPLKGSAAKRINMFLRWMVRSNKKKVDFELWKSISPGQLSCPLDIHTGRVARKLKILKRNQNDFKATLELDSNLKKFNPNDPVKYDFALFGLGIFEDF